MRTKRPIPDWAFHVARDYAGLSGGEENLFGPKKKIQMWRFQFAELVTTAEASQNREEHLKGSIHGWHSGYDLRPEGVSDAFWEGVKNGAKSYHYYAEWYEHGLPKWSQPPLSTHSYRESDYKHLPSRLRMPRCCRV